jgi:sec-independent protein translocase protein TatA
MTLPNLNIGFLQSLGAPEIFIIVFLVLLLFGAKKLPELARGMGKAMKEFKKATKDVEDDLRTAMDEEPEPAPRPKVVRSADTDSTTAESDK